VFKTQHNATRKVEAIWCWCHCGFSILQHYGPTQNVPPNVDAMKQQQHQQHKQQQQQHKQQQQKQLKQQHSNYKNNNIHEDLGNFTLLDFLLRGLGKSIGDLASYLTLITHCPQEPKTDQTSDVRCLKLQH
jgi:hypothetical protein